LRRTKCFEFLICNRKKCLSCSICPTP